MNPPADDQPSELPRKFEPFADVRVGQVIGPYRLVEKVGQGGMAEVYKAFHLRLERYEALKFILPHIAAEPTFRQRFEKEARLLAQLSHPNIVPIHAFGEEGPHCYLALEFVTGGTLKNALEKAGGGLALAEAARLVQQIGAALDYMHQHHVVHRDLKPGNIMLTPDGRVLLSDFGIAKLLEAQVAQTQTEAGGTPAYMAPEQLLGDATRIGPASDVYALGITLYEMLTGRLPFSATSIGEMALKQLNEPPPALRSFRADVPEAVEAVVVKALAKDPAQRYLSAGEMARDFLGAVGTLPPAAAAPPTWWPVPDDTQPAPGECPFKGLQYFDEADADLFFGRELLVAKLVGALRAHHFLAVVVGASGSGKSSIVRAGVAPALRRRGADGHPAPLADGTLPPEGSADWPIHIVTPGAHPLEALALSLTRDSESVTAATTLTDDLSRDPRALHYYVRKLLSRAGAAQHLLLIVDQFEELFTLCGDPAERKALIDNLLAAVAEQEAGPTVVIITLRADFYAHCAQYPNLREAVARHQEYIGAMSTDELRRAIEEPAHRGGWDLEPGLVETLLKDVGDEPGALPLLSHALLETWKRRQGRRLTLRGYAVSGGVRGAIARTADAVYAQLPPEQQAIARNIFLRLTELGEGTQDSRRRAALAELPPCPEDALAVEGVLKILTDARLVTTTADSAEVSHEALIREWPRLRAWLDEDRAGLRAHRQLTEAAEEWARREREAGLLYRGARLAEAGEWAAGHPEVLNALEREFLAESQRAVEREAAEREAQARRLLQAQRERAEEQTRAATRLRARNRVITAVGAMALLAAIVAAFFGYTANQSLNIAHIANAQAAANLARAENLRLAAEAGRLLAEKNGNVETAALLSVRALLGGYLPQADATLLQSAPRLYALRTFSGHTNAINSVAFSPDGKYVLTGSNDNTAKLWDATTGKTVRTFAGHAGSVDSVAFSPDGKYVLTGNDDCSAKFWDPTTFMPVRSFSVNTGCGIIAAFSPDGKYVLTANTDPTLWDAATGAEVRTFARNDDWAIMSVAFSPDGKYVLAGSADRTAKLWETATGTEVHTFTGHVGSVNAVAFSPDGKYILTGSDDKTTKLWDAATGAEVRTFAGDMGPVASVAFSPDGRYVLTGSRDNAAMWDLATGLEVRIYSGHMGFVKSVAFSPDGKYVLTGGDDQTAKLWDASAETAPALAGPGIVVFRGHTYSITSVAFSPDGKYVLTGSKDTTASLWDAVTGEAVRTFRGHTDQISSVAFSPDGKWVLTGSHDTTVSLWNAATGEEVRTFRGFKSWVASVAFSPDGKYILAGSADPADKTTKLWDAATGTEIRAFDGMLGVAFSPDGKYVLTGSGGPTALLWDATTGVRVRTFTGHTGMVSSVAFSPDGKYVLTTGSDDDKTATLWDAATGAEVRTFTGHLASVASVAYSPDGKYVLTGSMDDTAKQWDAATGAEVRTFTGHTLGINSVAFSPDGKYVLTGSGDNTAQLWNVDFREDIRRVCARLTRDLSPDERSLYGITDTQPTCPGK